MSDKLTPVEEFQRKYSTIFDRLERYTPEQRAEVLWTGSSLWCMGCGETYDICEDGDGCCCGTELADVTAKQCPKCEMIHMKTVQPRTDLR